MKANHSKDLEFLSNIRGRFQDSISNQRRDWVAISLFAVIFPALLLVFSFFDPERGRLFFIAMALMSLVLSVQLWRNRRVEYAFTGDEIFERCAGRVKNQICISDIVETKVKISPHQLIIKTTNSKMTVRIFPSLKEVIQRQAAEIGKNQTEAERQRFEEVKQVTISRLKRANIIAAIILMLLGFVIMLFVGWLKQKH